MWSTSRARLGSSAWCENPKISAAAVSAISADQRPVAPDHRRRSRARPRHPRPRRRPAPATTPAPAASPRRTRDSRRPPRGKPAPGPEARDEGPDRERPDEPAHAAIRSPPSPSSARDAPAPLTSCANPWRALCPAPAALPPTKDSSSSGPIPEPADHGQRAEEPGDHSHRRGPWPRGAGPGRRGRRRTPAENAEELELDRFRRPSATPTISAESVTSSASQPSTTCSPTIPTAWKQSARAETA